MFASCMERGSKKPLIWTELTSLPLSVLNPPLLWLPYHRSWALSELQLTLQPEEGCLALVHRNNTQMGTHPNNVSSPCRPVVGVLSPCSNTVEVQHPFEWMW